MSLLQRALLKRHEDNRANPHVVTAAQAAYDSAVSGFAPTTAAAALDALAGVRIVEMGENENGEYVRWENGLQICWRVKGVNIPVTTDAGALYQSDDQQTWLYPAVFMSGHAISVRGTFVRNADDKYRAFLSFHNITKTSVSYRVVATIAGSALAHSHHLFAIGTWKEEAA